MSSTNNLEIIANQSPFSNAGFDLVSFFNWLFNFLADAFYFITSPKLWSNLFMISFILSFCLIGAIVYTIVRIRELQIEDKEEIRQKTREALLKKQEKEKRENPKWHYILSVLEGYNDSDWRVAIMEADSMMENILKEKGLYGNTASELLESAKSNGYKNVQDAWSAHVVRNKIAHEGSDFPLSQVEARRIIKLYQNFFEELEVI